MEFFKTKFWFNLLFYLLIFLSKYNRFYLNEKFNVINIRWKTENKYTFSTNTYIINKKHVAQTVCTLNFRYSLYLNHSHNTIFHILNRLKLEISQYLQGWCYMFNWIYLNYVLVIMQERQRKWPITKRESSLIKMGVTTFLINDFILIPPS